VLCLVVFPDRSDVPALRGEVVQGAGLVAPLAADSSQLVADSSPDLPDSSLKQPVSSHSGLVHVRATYSDVELCSLSLSIHHSFGSPFMNGFVRRRNRAARLVAAAIAVCLVGNPGRTYASVIWDWSFAGTEAGTFTTNGTFADTASASNFTITNFTVTASTVSSLIGQPYSENQPVQGFLWSGVSPTEFYRDSGSFTNGSNFNVTNSIPEVYTFVFFADSIFWLGGLNNSSEDPVVGFSPLTLTPVAVPEPSTCAMALAGLACGGFSMFRRRCAR